MFHVYILKCSDGSFYTGHSDNIEKRLEQHYRGYFPTCYTYTRRPLEVVWYQGFSSRSEAIQAERKIKNWSHIKKYALINNFFETLRAAAKSTDHFK